MKKTQKKIRKVKRKTVKKKKVVKKKTKKKVVKKKRKTKKKVLMEDIYSILNKVQVDKKKVTFATHLIDVATIENTIQDVELKYHKVVQKTQALFTLYPDNTEYAQEEPLSLEIMDDEIPDIGQIF